MKKINFLAMSAVAAMCGFTSCDDKNECGCDCNQPIVERIEMVNNPGVSIPLDSAIAAGSTVALFGENLGSVKAIYFAEEKAELKPAFVTDNTIVFTIPTVYSTCKARFVTAACQAGFEGYPIVKVSPATVTMIYNEFATDTIRIKGNSFIASEGSSVDVYFYGEGDEFIKSPKTVVYGENEIAAAIPEGVVDTKPIRVTNVAAPSVENAYDSRILFRDKRNILVSFDEESSVCLLKGDTTGSHPEEMEIGANGNFAFLNDKAWSPAALISYQPFLPEFNLFEDKSVFMDFEDAIKNGELNLCDFCVKFEINVLESNKIKFDVMAIGFTDGKESGMGQFRQYAAYFNPCKAKEITNDNGSKEIKGEFETEFYTRGWMTVTIPFSEFMFNAEAMSYGSGYQAMLDNNTEAENYWKIFADPDNISSQSYVGSRPKCEGYPEIGGRTKRWHGLILGYTPNDGGNTNNTDVAVGIDNIRVVPNDENGAFYPALNWGVAKRHFYDAPVLK
ncbi:MAG: hypothetical protein J6R41_08330 [Paludibacteraceae bacterium]|nr:hypothetical protein [Paludibacteraceae bacterium]